MDTGNGGIQRNLDGVQPAESTDTARGRPATTGAERTIELEVPVASGVEVGRAPKAESPLRDVLKRLTPWSKPAPAVTEDAADARRSPRDHEGDQLLV